MALIMIVDDDDTRPDDDDRPWPYPLTTDEREAHATARAQARATGQDWAVYYRGHTGTGLDGTWRDLWSAAPLSELDDRSYRRRPVAVYWVDGGAASVVAVSLD